MTSIKLARRAVLRLAGAASLSAALMGALRAEGGSVFDLLGQMEERSISGTTPISIGAAGLRVRDLDRMIEFYTGSIGLEVIERSPNGAVLGAGGKALLHLNHMPEAATEYPLDAGLYHIAFLMPTRRALARWLVHAVYEEIPLTGLADHSVSEAIYLNDPEGNGLEIYADRPQGLWQWNNGNVTMGTYQLNVDALLSLVNTNADEFEGAPAETIIGHMHLRVGDIARGRAFYEAALGFDHMVEDRADSAFLASGGYHHHVAINTWNSGGAGLRNAGSLGLDWFSLAVRETEIVTNQMERLSGAGVAFTEIDGGLIASDPWSTEVRIFSV